MSLLGALVPRDRVESFTNRSGEQLMRALSALSLTWRPSPVNFSKAQSSQLEESRVLCLVLCCYSPHMTCICCGTRYPALRTSPSVRVQALQSDCEEGPPGSTASGGVIYTLSASGPSQYNDHHYFIRWLWALYELVGGKSLARAIW